MCWKSTNCNCCNLKEAEKPLKVYKILKDYCGEILSPIYMGTKWKVGELKETLLEEPCKLLAYWYIEKGFHCLRDKPVKGIGSWLIREHELFFWEPGERIFECEIPKGAHYYENEHGEIVTDKLEIHLMITSD